jgi:hypothetical protein
MKKSQFIITFISVFFINFCTNLFSQELVGVHVDHYYYNGVIFDNSVVVSSSDGLFQFRENSFVPFKYNTDHIDNRYIKHRGGKIIKGDFLESNYVDSILPIEYKGSKYSSIVFGDKIFVFVNGRILIYQHLTYSIQVINKNIKSISKAFYGTSSGIYNYDNELQVNLPSFTQGKIRDINNGIAICSNGLFIIKNGKFYKFSDDKNNFKIGDEILGKAKDIVEINPDEYLVSSSIGVHLINIRKNTSTSVLQTKNNVISKLKKNSDGNIFINDNSKIYLFDTKNYTVKAFYSHDSDIIDFIVSKDESLLYLLSNEILIELELKNNTKHILLNKLTDPKLLVEFSNSLLILSNEEIDAFDLSTGKSFYNIYNNSINPDSFYIEKDLLTIGTNTGILNIQEQGLESAKFMQEYKNNQADSNKILPYLLVFLTLIICVQFILLNKKRKTFHKNINTATDFSLEEKVKIYINNNISSVTVASIKEQFKIKNIYELFEDESPGDYIRTQRIKIVRKMRKLKSSEEEISKATGFSVSYLKKI